jgi:hypothetical protein
MHQKDEEDADEAANKLNILLGCEKRNKMMQRRRLESS